MMEKSVKRVLIFFVSLTLVFGALFYFGSTKLNAFAANDLESYVTTILEEAEPDGDVVTNEELDAILDNISNESAIAAYKIVTTPTPGASTFSDGVYDNYIVVKTYFLDAIMLVANSEKYTTGTIDKLRYGDREEIDEYLEKYEDPDYSFKRLVSVLTNDFDNVRKAKAKMTVVENAIAEANEAISAIKLYDKGVVTLADSIASIENATAKLNAIYGKDIKEIVEEGENVVEYVPDYETVYLAALENYKEIEAKIKSVNDLLDEVYAKYTDGKRLSIVSEVEGLKTAYNTLDDAELQALVVKYSEKLSEMETGIGVEKQNVNNVIAKINAIAPLHYTNECLERIELARTEYGKLIADSKTDDDTFVTNYTKLVASEKEYKRRGDALEKAKKDIYNAAVCEPADFKAKYYDAQKSWASLTTEEDFKDIFSPIMSNVEIFRSEVQANEVTFNGIKCNNYYDLYAEETSKFSENIRLSGEIERMISGILEVEYTSEYKEKLDKISENYERLDETVKPYVTLYPTFLEKVEEYEKIDEEVKALEEKYDVAVKADKNLSSATLKKIADANDAKFALFTKYPDMGSWLEENEEYSEKYAAFVEFENAVVAMKTEIEQAIASVGNVDLGSKTKLDEIDAKIEEYACDDVSAIANYSVFEKAKGDYVAVIDELNGILYDVYKIYAKDEAEEMPTENAKEEIEKLLAECEVGDEFTADIDDVFDIKKKINKLSERKDAELALQYVAAASEKLDEIAEVLLKNAMDLKDDIEKIKEPYDKAELENLQKRYDELSDDEKAFVDNYDKLKSAFESVYENEAKVVYDKIEALDEPYEIEILDAIQAEYDALSEEQKEKVTNYDKLKEAYFVLGVYDSGCEGSVGGQTTLLLLGAVAVLLFVKKRKA